jgi:hypothetical protein
MSGSRRKQFSLVRKQRKSTTFSLRVVDETREREADLNGEGFSLSVFLCSGGTPTHFRFAQHRNACLAMQRFRVS